MKKLILTLLCFAAVFVAPAQLPKVYDETLDPIAQLDSAIVKARAGHKRVLAQVGGNWCPWCLRLADFIDKDAEIKQLVDSAYVYIHLNYPRRGASEALRQKTSDAGRFGYPVLVIYDPDGTVAHIQDTALLEAGEGYDREKLIRTLRAWILAVTEK